MPDFGKYLKSVRESRKIGINQLATYAGVSASLISLVERGLRGVPKYETLEKILDALKWEKRTEFMYMAGYRGPENDVIKMMLRDGISEVAKRYLTDADRREILQIQKEALRRQADGEYVMFHKLVPDEDIFGGDEYNGKMQSGKRDARACNDKNPYTMAEVMNCTSQLQGWSSATEMIKFAAWALDAINTSEVFFHDHMGRDDALRQLVSDHRLLWDKEKRKH